MKKKTVFYLIIAVLVISLAGCAGGPNEMRDTPDEEGEIAGFWNGLWHGIISPVTFVISLFSDKTHMYEVHNNGGWYNFGFLIGASIILGGGGRGSAAGRRRRRKRDLA